MRFRDAEFPPQLIVTIDPGLLPTGFMWWELLMLWRQLYLVGFALLVMPGTVEQLMISFLIALSMMLLFAVAAPFKDNSDDYFAQVKFPHLRLNPYTYEPTYEPVNGMRLTLTSFGTGV